MASATQSSRRLLFGSIAFGLFVLFELALFGVLIFQSLSKREVNKVLLETQAEAQLLADQIASGAESQRDPDLFTAVASQRLVTTLIEEILHEKKLVKHMRILDAEGTLVWEGYSEQTRRVRPFPEGDELAAGERRVSEVVNEWEEPFERVEVPIDVFGTLQVGINPDELAARLGVLRQDLIRQAVIIGAVSILLLLTAYAVIWRLARKTSRLEEQAAEAERLAYIGTLASGLAHEIRNPLNSLNLNMQMLQEDEADAGNQRLLSITRSEIGRLEGLVTDFLSYARPRPPEVETVAVAGLLERTRQLLVGTARRAEVDFEVVDRTGGASLEVDAEQLGQLLLNLAQNALSAVEEVERPGKIWLRAKAEGEAVVLSVEDNGAGLGDADRERLFDLFYSNRKGGTGLGLAIVQRIAAAHGGRVVVADRPGGGTIMSVHLPQARGKAPSPASVPAAALSAGHR
ncbi:MAG: ATP-binding protein [Acidobacteriota bacterium]